ncbi:serine hydrolase domain-containing protein [Halalkalibacillus halophilus]|uniref:serine hydrolase domain-containing protein n=1 Tax=Halalkalibacillus halophilus TaxID=392827 RepID=UPI000420E0CB|nr:serine hydrolase [Halalkalibacillus halophilus]
MKKEKWIESFEEFIKPRLETYQVPGLGMGLMKNREVIYQKEFGYKNAEKDVEVTSDTIFGLASITKSFVAMAILQLQEQGKLKVEDPVVNYLSNFRMPKGEDASKVTLHHLLTNSSGLPPMIHLYSSMKSSFNKDPYAAQVYENLQVDPEEVSEINTYEELMDAIANTDDQVLGAPGEVFSYSNEGFGLLGAIVERVSGQDINTYMTEHIFKPIGMKNTSFHTELLNEHSLAMSYASEDDGDDQRVFASPTWWDAPAMLGAGFLKSTVDDMLQYSQVYCHGGMAEENRILEESSMNTMMDTHIRRDRGMYYGYGLVIIPDYHGHKLVEHGGSLKAISSKLVILPEEKVSGITLTNMSGLPAELFMFGALNHLIGLPSNLPLIEHEDYELTDQEIEEYIGVYQSGEGADIEISVKEGNLSFTNGDKEAPIRAVDRDYLKVKQNETEATVEILRNQDGQVYALTNGYRVVRKVK